MIAILGSEGMLGSMLVKTWSSQFWALNHKEFDAETDIPDLHNVERIVNCIGLIKPYCFDIQRAIKINALFPYLLPPGSIQIATDCVYSGKKGNYVETDVHDATDVYGKTKSLGESTDINNLRCSIIGPEIKHHTSLFDWFLSQEKANGFTNHLWNGITTFHFSLIVQAVLKNNIALPSIQHIVPADKVTKAELLRLISKINHKNIPVTDIEDSEAVDRTLATNNPDFNLLLWQAAGYKKPPTIEQMLIELSTL